MQSAYNINLFYIDFLCFDIRKRNSVNLTLKPKNAVKIAIAEIFNEISDEIFIVIFLT
jgi:hypothetical protein